MFLNQNVEDFYNRMFKLQTHDAHERIIYSSCRSIYVSMLLTVTSASYTGYVSMTTLGRVCQPWNMQRPHRHNCANPNYWSPSGPGSLDAAKNYCRDPDRTGYLWCFTTDPGLRWDSCDVDLQGSS